MKLQVSRFRAHSFAFILFVSCLWLPAASPASQGDWSKVAAEIEKGLNKAVHVYEAGRRDEAMEMVTDAYFGIFEGEKANMEIAVRRFISLKKASELEKGFADLRKGAKDGIKPGDFKKQTFILAEAVKAAAAELDRKGVGMKMQ